MPSKPGIRPAANSPASTPVKREVVEEAEADDAEEAGDRQLEAAVALRLQREDRERDHGGDQARGERRHAEQEVQRDRGADELGEVGGDRDRLGLHPQAPGDRAREALAAQLGQVAAGGDAGLGRQVLHEHRHQVRGDDHPDEQVAVARRRRRCSWRSCRDRCRRPRRRTPARAARSARGRARAPGRAAGRRSPAPRGREAAARPRGWAEGSLRRASVLRHNWDYGTSKSCGRFRLLPAARYP